METEARGAGAPAPTGWYGDPYSLAALRWWNGARWTGSSANWDGTSWQLGEDLEVAASYERAAEAARRARRPITVWFWFVVVLAFVGFLPTLWAQQDFGQPMHGLSCSEEPWHVDPAGMRAWWIWTALLALLAVGGSILLRGTRRGLRDDRRASSMFTACILIAVLVPPIGWTAAYMMAGMNCAL